MLVVTARLFKDNQLVGYRLSDGQSTQDLTKQQVWVYAKNKQIINVIATGTEIEPVISGTNGFELKKLTEINLTNLPNEEFKEEMSHESADELEKRIMRKYVEKLFEGTRYKPEDLPKLSSRMPGNNQQEKFSNLLKFLEEDKLKRAVKKKRSI